MSTKSLDRILREPECKRITGLSRTTRWRGVRDCTFPKPVKITSTTIGWFETDVARWLAERRAAAGLCEHKQSNEPSSTVK
jgi:prophage regulatory protein